MSLLFGLLASCNFFLDLFWSHTDSGCIFYIERCLALGLVEHLLAHFLVSLANPLATLCFLHFEINVSFRYLIFCIFWGIIFGGNE